MSAPVTPAIPVVPDRLRAEVRDAAARLEDLVAALPAPAERGPDQRALAAEAHERARAARRRLLAVQADRLGREVVGPGRYRSLTDMAYDLADIVPGLAPSRAEMEVERGRRQSAKEGLEVDQGIVYSALFGSSVGVDLLRSQRSPTADACARLPEFQRTAVLEMSVVSVRRTDGVAEITVANERYLNAEDAVLGHELEVAVDLALLDPGVRVGLVRGGVMKHPRYAGRRVFCPGINLTLLCAGQIPFLGFVLQREVGYLSKIRRGLWDPGQADDPAARGGKPWVAVIDEFAIGGGLQLMLTFDYVISSDTAYFTLPAAREGIVPGAANLRLGRALGARLARQMLLGGRRIDARDPLATLLCDAVVGEDAVDGAVERAVRALDSPAVVANRHMLTASEEPEDQFRSYVAEFAEVQARRLYSPDVLHRLEQQWTKRQH
ncbi:thioesterase DpgC [Micromonospora profundi]|uniref:enoyl-CoA hydratase/isomerase family protein n=1 Tax=Micromonospora profundi TaxID=1420889 RepID=UPI0016955EC9|nr:enoyl-CoA hydratase/isomerase family protein [Micromonospora profundi]NJC11482.1 thioesterase DpgC [Micromonospora profundi]